jgi:hypothetical protein
MRCVLGVVSLVAVGILTYPALTPSHAEREFVMSKPTLRSMTLLDAPSPLERSSYCFRTGLSMIGPSGWSDDNGRTWTPFTPTPDFDSDLPYGYRRGPIAPWLDPVNGNILVLVNSMDTPGLDPSVDEPPEGMQNYYLRYRVSIDGGRTYILDEPIIQEGDYTPQHPLEGVWIGKNSFFLGDAGCRPIRTRAGEILVPMQTPPLDSEGNFHNPGGGWYWLDTRILIGRWTQDNRIIWSLSDAIKGDNVRTARGLYEPTLAQMPDGRILCVMRGSNGGKRDPMCVWGSYKWYAISEDGGRRWSLPRAWRYTDGERFYSPSSMSQLLTHSSGRIFWIGNLSAANCRENHPRWPLVIAEVDPKTCLLVRDTVLEIDTKRPDEEDVNLSHFLAFEDRETGDIVIPMARYSAGYRSAQPVLYVIRVQ